MSNIIIKKYKNLYEACKKYPKITLSSKWEKSSKSYEKTKQYAKDSFAEESGGGIVAEISSYEERMEEFHKMANISPGWFNVTEIEEIDLCEYVK